MKKERMRTSLRRVLQGIVFLALTVSCGTLGYVLLSDASVLDALFMVVITIFSVGYEETIRVDEPVLKLYTIFFIVAGCSSLLYILGGLIQMATEGEIYRALGQRRMTRGISNLKNHTIICGFGRMGQILAQELEAAGAPFVVVEKNDERSALAEEMDFLVLHSNATGEAALVDARITEARALATVLPVDADNVFITLSARNLNPNLKIFARGEIPTTEQKLLQAGADHVVLPATIGGVRMAHMIARPAAAHLLSSLGNAEALNSDLDELGVHLSEIHVEPDSDVVGHSIAEIEIVGTGAYLVVAMRRADGSILTKPHGDTKVEANDAVVVIGHGSVLPKLTLEPTPAREIYAASDVDEARGAMESERSEAEEIHESR